jgi:crossover junction endodeoxyribonuclease RuvC
MAHARGVILLCGQRRGLALIEVAPATVKKAMTGHGTASKRQMQTAVAATFGLDAPPEPPDVADAIAIALAGARRR